MLLMFWGKFITRPKDYREIGAKASAEAIHTTLFEVISDEIPLKEKTFSTRMWEVFIGLSEFKAYQRWNLLNVICTSWFLDNALTIIKKDPKLAMFFWSKKFINILSCKASSLSPKIPRFSKIEKKSYLVSPEDKKKERIKN